MATLAKADLSRAEDGSIVGTLWRLGALTILFGLGAFWIAAIMTGDAQPGRAGELAAIVSALYSGLAFAGVIYALVLQKRELQLQRSELAQTRAVLDQQNRTLDLQRFEHSFFNLLKAHRSLVDATRATFDVSGTTLQGIQAFSHAAHHLTGRFGLHISPEPTGDTLRTLADDWFAGVCHRPASEFGHCMRSLYHLVDFVRRAPVTHKWPYILLIRAQLSNGEQTMVYLYGLTSEGRGLKNLAERYHLLRGLREDPAISRYREHYVKAAFGATRRTRLHEPPEPAI